MSQENTEPVQDTPLYLLKGATINRPDGPLLKDMEWFIRDHAVTVLFGPGGTGKSMLLRILSGNAPPTHWSLQGSWRYREHDLSGGISSNHPPAEIAWFPQRKRLSPHQRLYPSSSKTEPPQVSWREILDSGALTVLLDEPTRGIPEEEVTDLVQALRAHTKHGAAIVVTHNLAFAREVADEVCLLCAGEIVACGEAERFFNHPPSDLAAQFLRQGNCSPPPRPQPLPPHFNWILPGRLAGMGKPGLLGNIDEDLTAIATAGITHLVSLTKDLFSAEKLLSYGITGRHFPITDMSVPAIGPTASLCRDIKRQMGNGEGVALHCHAGLGRTGTILACILVWIGRSPDDAIKEIRAIGKGYIQNKAQHDFVHRFAEDS